MIEPALEVAMAKKKSVGKDATKQYGTLIRVSDEFADAIRDASSFSNISQREFADMHLLSIIRKIYRDAVIAKAKEFGGKG